MCRCDLCLTVDPTETDMKPLKGFLFLLCLFLISIRASAQVPAVSTTGAISPTEMQLAQWAITQGGLVVVVLVIIWSYRRDFHRIFQSEHERSKELIMALEASTSALSTHAEMMRNVAQADRDSAKAFQDLAATVRACEAVRDTFNDMKMKR